jgi:dihydrofolate reductase
MRKLALHMIVSIDGIFSSEYGSVNPHTQWDEEIHRFYLDLFTASGGVVFGRNIYEQYVGHWSRVARGEIPAATDYELRWTQRLTDMPKFVISSSAPTLIGHRDQVLSSEVERAVSKLKDQPGGDLLLMCGPALLAQLNRMGLIDEYMLYVCPNALGHGRHLFADIDEPLSLTVEQTVPFASGMTFNRYARVR